MRTDTRTRTSSKGFVQTENEGRIFSPFASCKPKQRAVHIGVALRKAPLDQPLVLEDGGHPRASSLWHMQKHAAVLQYQSQRATGEHHKLIG